MSDPDFTIRTINRGEQARYTDDDVELTFEQSWGAGHRIYCDSITADSSGTRLPFLKRKRIIQNCCTHFGLDGSEVVLVIDEADPDRAQLESFFSDQKALGQDITVEYDSEKKRQRRHDQMIIDCLQAGEMVSLNGVTYTTVDGYLNRKES